ncbi:MAG: response regulator [Desulfovibrionaceae bacterium]|nr:response regulator [Desulfovibrionaceae bacterium]
MDIFKDLSERMPGGFFVYSADQDEKILYANSTAQTIFGCATYEDFIDHVGGSFSGMVYPEDRTFVQMANKKDAPLNVVCRIEQKGGAIRWIECYGRIVHTEQGDLNYVFFCDITAKKEAQEAREQNRKRLIEVKNRLIFNLARDILTPTKAVLRYTEQAKNNLEDVERLKKCLENVTSACKLHAELTNDLLGLAKFDEDIAHPQMEKSDLALAVENTVDMVKPEFEAKGIDVSVVTCQGDTKVLMVAHRFQRALLHILSNAAKITPAGGKITLAIRKQDFSDSEYTRFEIVVSDIGSGTPALSPEKAKEELDLSDAVRIMDIFGGKITVESEPDKSLTCTLSLPLKLIDGPVDTQAQKTSARKASAKRRLLLVEDIEMSRLQLEDLLSESEFEVESVSDGRIAVETVASKPEGYYAAILMDIQMPVMNGYEATRAIRALGTKDVFSLPIIALSANSRMDDKILSFESGMNEHVAKPFDAEGLIATINKYLRGK